MTKGILGRIERGMGQRIQVPYDPTLLARCILLAFLFSFCNGAGMGSGIRLPETVSRPVSDRKDFELR